MRFQKKILTVEEGIDQSRILQQYEETGRRSIMTAYRGSICHGMYVPPTDPNSIDDIDLMSVCVLPASSYIGTIPYMTKGTREIKDGKFDIVCYDVRKFINLLLKGNPNVLCMLYLDSEDYLIKTDWFDRLVANRNIFLSKEIYHSFVGYAVNQSKRMTHLAYQGYMGEKRKSLVQLFGYDTKNAAHLIRLMRMAVEFLQDGTFKVKRDDADELVAIKNGKKTLFEIQEEAIHLFKLAEKLFETCDLPAIPDLVQADEICCGIIQEFLAL